NDTLDTGNGDMSKYIDKMCADFITGTKSLDEWDAYVAQLEEMGAAKKLRVYQAAVDRYHALTTMLH
ncbi:MAG: hypothetical protein PHC80_08430, partial [Eubacteriales bacterium]|nr:hypothetical protein [Eubacteriales bacterium]